MNQHLLTPHLTGAVPASIGKRVGAQVLDWIIVFLIGLVGWSIFLRARIVDDGALSPLWEAAGFIVLVISLVLTVKWFCYDLWMKGMTPAYRILGLRIASFNTPRRPGVWPFLRHLIVNALSSVSGGILPLVFLFVQRDNLNRLIWDRATNLIVVDTTLGMNPNALYEGAKDTQPHYSAAHENSGDYPSHSSSPATNPDQAPWTQNYDGATSPTPVSTYGYGMVPHATDANEAEYQEPTITQQMGFPSRHSAGEPEPHDVPLSPQLLSQEQPAPGLEPVQAPEDPHLTQATEPDPHVLAPAPTDNSYGVFHEVPAPQTTVLPTGASALTDTDREHEDADPYDASGSHDSQENPSDSPATIAISTREHVRVVLDNGQSIPVFGTLLIGRNPQPTERWQGATVLPIADDQRSVSQTHAALSIHGDQVTIEDLGSTNGTQVVGADGSVTYATPGVVITVPQGATVRVGERSFTIER